MVVSALEEIGVGVGQRCLYFLVGQPGKALLRRWPLSKDQKEGDEQHRQILGRGI